MPVRSARADLITGLIRGLLCGRETVAAALATAAIRWRGIFAHEKAPDHAGAFELLSSQRSILGDHRRATPVETVGQSRCDSLGEHLVAAHGASEHTRSGEELGVIAAVEFGEPVLGLPGQAGIQPTVCSIPEPRNQPLFVPPERPTPVGRFVTPR